MHYMTQYLTPLPKSGHLEKITNKNDKGLAWRKIWLKSESNSRKIQSITRRSLVSTFSDSLRALWCMVAKKLRGKKLASCIILYYRFSLLDVQLETQLAGLDIFSLLFTDSRRKIFLRYKKYTNNCNCAIYSIFSFFSLFLLFTISWFNFPWSVFYKLYKIVWANGFWEHKKSLSFETQRL